MLRRLILWLMIALMPLQGLRAAEHMLELPLAEHWVDHELRVAHHHHDDGTVHHDDSASSHEHVGEHLGCHGCALPQAVLPLKLPMLPEARPDAPPAEGRADPYLAPPPRPPHTAG